MLLQNSILVTSGRKIRGANPTQRKKEQRAETSETENRIDRIHKGKIASLKNHDIKNTLARLIKKIEKIQFPSRDQRSKRCLKGYKKIS